jgi:uncharacterized membrane protein
MSAAAARWRTATLLLLALLLGVLLGWQLLPEPTMKRALLALLLLVPLCAPLPGILTGTRRTYAWATLCVIPYFVVGITESIASPHNRRFSGLCLALSLLLFVSLIGYLRVTRPVAAPDVSL